MVLTTLSSAAWISDPINELVGRRTTIFIAAIFSVLAPIGQACSQTWEQLLVCRILLGIGIFLSLSLRSAPPTNHE
jgi:MFS family permease